MENFNQGRRPGQYESNAKVMTAGCVGFLGVIVMVIIYGILF
jgi:hypothetical protein